MTQQVGAPITRYADLRLTGGSVVHAYKNLYATWIRPWSNPIHPQTNSYLESTRRSCSACAGIVACAILGIFAVIAHLVQIVHYHMHSEEERAKPALREYQGMKLPQGLVIEVGNTKTFAKVTETEDTSIDNLRLEIAERLLRGENVHGYPVDGNISITSKPSDAVLVNETASLGINYESLKQNCSATWIHKGDANHHFDDALTELLLMNGIRILSLQDQFVYADLLAEVTVRTGPTPVASEKVT